MSTLYARLQILRKPQGQIPYYLLSGAIQRHCQRRVNYIQPDKMMADALRYGELDQRNHPRRILAVVTTGGFTHAGQC
jgi:hypothetical protein